MDNAAMPSQQQRHERPHDPQRRNAQAARQDGARTAEEAICSQGVCKVTWKPKRTEAA